MTNDNGARSVARSPVWWEDFEPGKVLETGSVRVTKDEIVEFARRYDPQPFHLDEEAARESIFGGLTASGWLTCCLSMRLMCDAYLLDTASAGSPGLESLKWLKPVYPGDVLRVRVTALETRPSVSRPQIGLVRSRMETLNQDDVIVPAMEIWQMLRRRVPGASA